VHNEELHDLCSWPNIVLIKKGGMHGNEKCIKGFGGKTGRKVGFNNLAAHRKKKLKK
jgi:hypothetical protein